MREITHQQRKHEILNLVAQTRVGVLDSASKAQSGACVCMEVLHISRKTLRYAGLAALGYAGLKIAGRIVRGVSRSASATPKVLPAPPPPSETAPEPSRGLLRYLVAQLFTLVLLPWVKDWLTGTRVTRKLDYWRPSRIFFRWIGLER